MILKKIRSESSDTDNLLDFDQMKKAKVSGMTEESLMLINSTNKE